MNNTKQNKENEIYEYLENKNFKYYLPDNINFREKNKECKDSLPTEDKGIEIIHLITLLHNKTTTYEKININEIKEIYESNKNKIMKINEYYLALQDKIESKIFYSPEENLLINNISKIYRLLQLSNYFIDEWYKKITNDNKIKKVLIHNNLKISNLKYKNNEPFLTNWNKAEKNFSIFDIVKFYKNEFSELEMFSLYNIYKGKYFLSDIEEKFLFSLLSIPPQIIFKKNHLINTINVKYLNEYVDKTLDFVLKNDKKE